jgi:nucleoid-associated protein YgaU
MGIFDRKQPPPKKKADFSNVQSGKSTTAPPPAAPPQPAPPPKVARTHTVVSGDSLSKIAKKYLGNANRWNELYEANRAVVGDNPNLIKPGQVLTIPEDKKA